MMRESGYEQPRIAVAGLNPHAGDNGNFGREEIDVIAPAIAAGRREGIVCQGPFPSDTVFVRARKGEFDAVLTMYHDQGQIAIKLLGFEQGVTLLGGFPFPVLTAAHGSAYDIAGKGVANPGAMREAARRANGRQTTGRESACRLISAANGSTAAVKGVSVLSKSDRSQPFPDLARVAPTPDVRDDVLRTVAMPSRWLTRDWRSRIPRLRSEMAFVGMTADV
jgi:Pyridoxal phosphate biosynthetic protein PdxA